MATGYSVEIDNVEQGEWSKIMQRFDDASIYQTFPYGSVRWGQDNLSHLVLKKDGEIVGATQSRILKSPVLRAGVAYIRWGPMWRIRGKAEGSENLRQIVGALREEYVERRGLFLRILPNVFDDEACADTVRSTFESEGLRWNRSPYRTILMDLQLSMEELERNLTPRWRRQLNIARRKGLKLIEGTGDEVCEAFQVIYNEMVARKGFVPGMDIHEYSTIQKELPDSLKMIIMLCKAEGDVVAGLIGSPIGNTGIYLFGATSDEGLKSRGSYLLQWQMIERLKEYGVPRYDLNGYDPDRESGTAAFKAGLSGKDVRQIGQFEVCRSQVGYFLIKSADWLRIHF